MATINELKEMALHVAKGTAPANFSAEDVRTAYAAEISGLCSSINEFKKNRYDIFQIISEVADEILPVRTLDRIGAFAEVETIGQGQRKMFTVKKGRNRAKKFLTQVGLAGVYEAFRLDSDTFEIRAHAIGGAARLDYERFLDGAENINELMEIVYEGLEEAIYMEINKALKGAIKSANMPTRNKAISNGFVAKDMQRVIGVVKAYGTDAVIFATPEFIEEMGPDAIGIYPVGHNTLNPSAIYHPQDIDDIRNTGRIKMFRGTPIVEIPQSFVDEKNEEVLFDPQYAYILPTGGEKVVKVVLEGATQVYDRENRDLSTEINIYKKVGVGILTMNNWGVYCNTALNWAGTTSPGAALSVGNPTVAASPYGIGIG